MTEIAERRAEIAAKLERLRARMAEAGVNCLILRKAYNISWLTAGATFVIDLTQESASNTLVVTPTDLYIVTDHIEAPRLRQDEHLDELGFTFITDPWYARGNSLSKLTAQRHVGQDSPGVGQDCSALLQQLRSTFLPEEIARYAIAGRLAAAALETTMRGIRPGQSEFDVAAQLAAASRERGGIASVNLIASDARIAAFRHPLPTAKAIERYVMVVLCFRYQGLVAAATRFVHFGPLSDDLERKAEITAQVDATLIQATTLGRTMGDMWAVARDAYTAAGYPHAIEEHHQGGSIGYLSREFIATPDNPTPIALNQAFAWNPSVAGSKSEDTIILTDQGPQIITAMPDWPSQTIEVHGQQVTRPNILLVDE